MGATPFITIHELSKTFRPTQRSLRPWRWFARPAPIHALRDCSLTVERGETVGLLGANGAGKSTLLRILAAILLPSGGTVVINGSNVTRAPRAVRALIGFAGADDRSFYWRLTGRQNLEFFGALYGLRRAHAAQRIDELREAVGLEALERPVHDYSTGMRQRLSLARALLHHPALLLLDEPTRSIDPVAAASFRALLRDYCVLRQRCTILLATHAIDEAALLCDRLIILHEGRPAVSGTPLTLDRHLPSTLPPAVRQLVDQILAIGVPHVA